MSVYVLRVRPSYEEEICSRLRQMGFDAFAPMKTMQLRNGGTWFEKTSPIFTQYVFIRFTPKAEDYYAIRSVPGVIRFLGRGKPQAISKAEEAYITWLWNGGKPLGISKVYVSAQGAKMVLSGPLRQYRGEKIEYHLRQRRVVITISFCGKKYRITLPVIAI